MPRQTLRYGLSNSLVAKNQGSAQGRETGNLEAEAGEDPGRPLGVQPQAADSYFQFLKFGIFSSYELADNSDLTSRSPNNYDAKRNYDTDYHDQGSGPLETYLEAFFNPYFSTRLVSNFNTHTGRAISHDLSLTAADGRGDRLTLTYDYDTPEAKYLPANTRDQTRYQEARADLSLRLNSEWSTRLFTRYDLKGNKALKSTAQFTYQAQCYGLSLVYSKLYQEQSVGLIFDLMGLGSIDFSGAGVSE
jgi:lipopolysaccharide assembly outer membrane protein LptD (OstA)